MKRSSDGIRLESARPSRAGDGALAIANFSHCARPWSEEDFGGATEISPRDVCAPRSFRFAARSTGAT
jgi:hypothetical protein